MTAVIDTQLVTLRTTLIRDGCNHHSEPALHRSLGSLVRVRGNLKGVFRVTLDHLDEHKHVTNRSLRIRIVRAKKPLVLFMPVQLGILSKQDFKLENSKIDTNLV